MTTLKVIWSNRAKIQLRKTHDYIKYKLHSPQGAKSVKQDILKASKNILFVEQYEADEIESAYRRILVRHYKLLYKEKNGEIYILSIFDTLQSPERQIEENY